MSDRTTLKRDFQLLQSLFPPTHHVFQVTRCTLDELACNFIAQGCSFPIVGNIMENYPVMWCSDVDDSRVTELLSVLSEEGETCLLKQIDHMLCSLCDLFGVVPPPELSQLKPSTSPELEGACAAPTNGADTDSDDDADPSYYDMDDDFSSSQSMSMDAEGAATLDRLERKANELKKTKLGPKVVSGYGNVISAGRLMQELREIFRSEQLKNGTIAVELINDNIFEWRVQLRFADGKSDLSRDLVELRKSKCRDCVLLHFVFKTTFPFDPPFVRVVSPVLLSNGLVLDGGAICLEVLTKQGWNVKYSMESVIVQVSTALLDDGVRVLFDADSETQYTLEKAQDTAHEELLAYGGCTADERAACEYVGSLFPMIDPQYVLREIVEQHRTADAVVEQLMREHTFPTRAERRRIDTLIRRREEILNPGVFSVEHFLRRYVEPEATFGDETSQVSAAYRRLCYVQLANDFPTLVETHIRNRMQAHSGHYLTTFRELTKDLARFEGGRKPFSTLGVFGMNFGRWVAETPRVPMPWPSDGVFEEQFFYEVVYAKNEAAVRETMRAEAEKRSARLREAHANGVEHQLCEICLEERLDDEFVPCAGPSLMLMPHRACTFCVRRHAEVSIGSSGKSCVECLAATCANQYSLETLRRLVSPSLISLMLRRQTEDGLSSLAGALPEGERLETCPFCQYAAITMTVDDERVFRCYNPECLKDSCRLCRMLAHAPFPCNTVDQDAFERYVANAMAEELIRECPKCKMRVLKEGGCNHMTCTRCRVHFCYICRAELPALNPYAHFDAARQAVVAVGAAVQSPKNCPLHSVDEWKTERARIEGAGRSAIDEYMRAHPNAGLTPTSIAVQKLVDERPPPPSQRAFGIADDDYHRAMEDMLYMMEDLEGHRAQRQQFGHAVAARRAPQRAGVIEHIRRLARFVAGGDAQPAFDVEVAPDARLHVRAEVAERRRRHAERRRAQLGDAGEVYFVEPVIPRRRATGDFDGRCFNCQLEGHRARECPQPERGVFGFLPAGQPPHDVLALETRRGRRGARGRLNPVGQGDEEVDGQLADSNISVASAADALD